VPRLTRTLATIELADGTVHENVRVLHVDVMNYKRTAQKHGWPALAVKDGVGTVPHLDYEETFTAWSALKRLGLYAGTWETFLDVDCVGLAVETEEVDPTTPPADGTLPAAGSGSASSLPTTPDSTSNGSRVVQQMRT